LIDILLHLTAMCRHNNPVLVRLRSPLLISAIVFSQYSWGIAFEYDPSLGSLPENQGWIKYEAQNPSTPFVAGGTLHVSSTEGGEQLWVMGQDQGFNRNFEIGSKLSFEIKFDIVTGTYAPPDGGFFIGFNGEMGQYSLAFTNNQILINGWESTLDYDPLTDFTQYEATVTNLGIELRINGELKDISQFTSPGFGGGAISFGDISYDSEYAGQIKRVSFDSVPEPASMTLLGLGAVALIRKKRKS
jgi:hypothetical protein